MNHRDKFISAENYNFVVKNLFINKNVKFNAQNCSFVFGF